MGSNHGLDTCTLSVAQRITRTQVHRYLCVVRSDPVDKLNSSGEMMGFRNRLPSIVAVHMWLDNASVQRIGQVFEGIQQHRYSTFSNKLAKPQYDIIYGTFLEVGDIMRRDLVLGVEGLKVNNGSGVP